jgi:hypothetical protein
MRRKISFLIFRSLVEIKSWLGFSSEVRENWLFKVKHSFVLYRSSAGKAWLKYSLLLLQPENIHKNKKIK